MLETKDYIIVTAKPEPLGSGHPSNKPGCEYFTLAKQVIFYNKSWNKLFEFMIDERHFNTLSYNNGRGNEVVNSIMEEFKKMKLSDPGYGSYDGKERKSQGNKPLYVHDFMLWLKNNGF